MVNKSITCCFVKHLTWTRFLEIWLIEFLCGPTEPAVVRSPPRLQHPSRSCATHKTHSALSRNLNQLCFAPSPRPAVTGRSGGVPRSPRRASPDRTKLPENAGRACPALWAWVSVFCPSHALSPPSRERFLRLPRVAREFNTVRRTASAQRSQRQMHTRISLAANLWIMWTSLRSAGWSRRLSRLNNPSKKPEKCTDPRNFVPVNICWDVYALEGSVRKLCRIGLWCPVLTGLFS